VGVSAPKYPYFAQGHPIPLDRNPLLGLNRVETGPFH
jgi:hypothetical protein